MRGYSFNIVVYDQALGRAIDRIILDGYPGCRNVVYRHGDVGSLSADCLLADLWVIQAASWNWIFRSDGFHLGRSLARAGVRTLLLFSLGKPDAVKNNGPCWRTMSADLELAREVDTVLDAPPAPVSAYDNLAEQWPRLRDRNIVHGN